MSTEVLHGLVTRICVGVHDILVSMAATINVSLPVCLEWDYDQVADWVGSLGFDQYKVF